MIKQNYRKGKTLFFNDFEFISENGVKGEEVL